VLLPGDRHHRVARATRKPFNASFRGDEWVTRSTLFRTEYAGRKVTEISVSFQSPGELSVHANQQATERRLQPGATHSLGLTLLSTIMIRGSQQGSMSGVSVFKYRLMAHIRLSARPLSTPPTLPPPAPPQVL
jgi:hypothetical protein